LQSIANGARNQTECIVAMRAKVSELTGKYVEKESDLKPYLDHMIQIIERKVQPSFVSEFTRKTQIAAAKAREYQQKNLFKRMAARNARLMPPANIWLICKKDIGSFKKGKYYWVERIDHGDDSFLARESKKDGNSRWCYIRDFINDDNFQATTYFEHYYEPSKSSSRSQDSGCFSSEVTLSTPDGLKKLHELQAGDYVETFDGSFTRVLAVVKHAAKLTPMLRLEVGSKSLNMTANHLVFIDGAGYIRTDKVMVGDCINGEEVSAITTDMKHAMCLHTFKHDIMVNSLRATWYTEEEKFIMKFQPLWNILDKTAPYYPQFLIDCLQLVTDVIVRAMDEDFISGWFVGILLLIIGTILAICTGSLILGFVGAIYLLFQHSGSSFGISYFLQN